MKIYRRKEGEEEKFPLGCIGSFLMPGTDSWSYSPTFTVGIHLCCECGALWKSIDICWPNDNFIVTDWNKSFVIETMTDFFFKKGVLFFFSFCVWPHHVACAILVPRPGRKPTPSAVEAPCLNHWTTEEVLNDWWLIYLTRHVVQWRTGG